MDATSADMELWGTEDGSFLGAVTTAFDPDGTGLPVLLLSQVSPTPGGAGLLVVDPTVAASGPALDSAVAGLLTWSPERELAAVVLGDTDYSGSDNLLAGVWALGLWDLRDLRGFVDEADADAYTGFDEEGEWLTGAAAVGDFDGDARADFALLAEDWPSATEVGRLALLPGERQFGGSLDFGSAIFFAEGSSAGESFAYRVAVAGDADGDGAGDLWVGAPGSAHNGTGTGSVYLLPLPEPP